MDIQTVACFSTVASFLPVHMNPEDSSLLVDKIQVEANSFIVVIVQAKDSLQMVKMVQDNLKLFENRSYISNKR
jgi:hypothetical protein